MNQRTLDRLHHIVDYGYEFDFGGYISRGIRLWSRYWVGFSGFAMLAWIIAFVAANVPLLGIPARYLLSIVLHVGIFMVARNIQKGQQPDFGMFFNGFRHFGKLAGVAMLELLILVVIFVVAGLSVLYDFPFAELFGDSSLERKIALKAWAENINWLTFIPAAIILLPFFYLMIAWQFARMLVVFEDAGVWEAMEWSRKIIGKHWLWFFAMTALLHIAAKAGAVGLIIGTFVVVAIEQVVWYVMYEEIVGSDEAEEEAPEDLLMPEQGM